MARTALRRAAACVGVVLGLALGPQALADPDPGCKPQHGKPAYPPGQCKKGGTSPSTAAHGQRVTAASGQGQFTPGTAVAVELHSHVVRLPVTTADSLGEATVAFIVPASLLPGRHQVVFTGDFFGTRRSVAVPFDVTDSVTALPRTDGPTFAGIALPRTGASIATAAGLGIGLVGLGSATAASARRRRVI
jgi:hypothetical protein